MLAANYSANTRSWEIVPAHNRPPDSLKASHADVSVTRKLKGAAQLLDMDLHDHLIITVEGIIPSPMKGCFKGETPFSFSSPGALFRPAKKPKRRPSLFFCLRIYGKIAAGISGIHGNPVGIISPV